MKALEAKVEMSKGKKTNVDISEICDQYYHVEHKNGKPISSMM